MEVNGRGNCESGKWKNDYINMYVRYAHSTPTTCYLHLMPFLKDLRDRRVWYSSTFHTLYSRVKQHDSRLPVSRLLPSSKPPMYNIHGA